jgi:hypothetical protein
MKIVEKDIVDMGSLQKIIKKSPIIQLTLRKDQDKEPIIGDCGYLHLK